MDDVSLTHAKEHLEDLIARARAGEEVCVSDPKLGTVRLVPVDRSQSPRPKRVIGQWKDKFEVPARLFEPLTDDDLQWLSGEDSP